MILDHSKHTAPIVKAKLRFLKVIIYFFLPQKN